MRRVFRDVGEDVRLAALAIGPASHVDLPGGAAPALDDLVEAGKQVARNVHEDVHVLVEGGGALRFPRPEASEIEIVVPSELSQLVPPDGPGFDPLLW